MSRLGLAGSRNSRGSSRGIAYNNGMKNSAPNYGSSSLKKEPEYEQRLLKSQLPTSSNYKNTKMTSYQDYGNYNYEYLLGNKNTKINDKLTTENEIKR